MQAARIAVLRSYKPLSKRLLLVRLNRRLLHRSIMENQKKRKSEETGNLSPPPLRKQKVESSTTKEAVSSFFNPASLKHSGKITWTTVSSTLLAGHYQSSAEVDGTLKRETRQKIAAFDLDSTLIKSASGRKYGKEADDWMWWHPRVPATLRQLDADQSQIVILSNQSGLNLGENSKTAKIDQKRLNDFKAKVGSICKRLDVSLSFYAATERDSFRKPRIGMWTEVLDHFDLDDSIKSVDKENSIFVGDAGGRLKEDKTMGKDFSSSDRDFASNVGIKFATPEEFFLGEPQRAFERAFDPKEYLNKDQTVAEKFTKTNEQDIVLFCASPGAGKSTFYWNHLAALGYDRVNQDILKTRDKCLLKAIESLKAGRSVVVDNTNAEPEIRAHWVKLANEYNVPIRAVVIRTNAKMCEHNDAVRALNGTLMNPEHRTRLPEIAFWSFAKRFREPSLDEGFQDIISVEFKFVGNQEQKAAWTQYYV